MNAEAAASALQADPKPRLFVFIHKANLIFFISVNRDAVFFLQASEEHLIGELALDRALNIRNHRAGAEKRIKTVRDKMRFQRLGV